MRITESATHQSEQHGVGASTSGSVSVGQPELRHVVHVCRGLAVHAAREHAAKHTKHITTKTDKINREYIRSIKPNTKYHQQSNRSGELLWLVFL